MKINNLIASIMMMTGLFAQSIVGTITDVDSKPLEGANVVVQGTDLGGISTSDGTFSIKVDSGQYNVVASFIGYKSFTQLVDVKDDAVSINFVLEVDAVVLSDIEVLASRADENTPVAYTNVGKEELEFRLGSQDVPMALSTTPSQLLQ